MPLKLVRHGGRANWYIAGSIRGIHVRESSGVTDRDAAEAILAIRSRQVLDESIFGKPFTATFDEAAEAYLNSGGSPRFLDPLREAFGKKPLRDIRQVDLDAGAVCALPAASPETRNRNWYTPFIAVWNHAVVNEWAAVRKWRRPRRPKGTRLRSATTRAGVLPTDYETAARFVAHMSPAAAQVLTVLFFTGLRPIELFSLMADDVELARRWLLIRNSKTGEPRGVPIHEFVVPVFESLLALPGLAAQAPLFVSSRGEPYAIRANAGGQLRSALNGARKRSSIPGISLYTARHTVSTQLVINGVHPHIKDQILGHAVDSMSRRYTHVPQAPLIEAINTIVVPNAWRDLPWLTDPSGHTSKLIGWGRIGKT